VKPKGVTRTTRNQYTRERINELIAVQLIALS